MPNACEHADCMAMRSPSDRVLVWTCPDCEFWLIVVDGNVKGIGADFVADLIEAIDDVGERVDGVASRELREFAAGFAERHGAHGERSGG